MFLALVYLAATVIGLYPFRGIPVVNIALGFPIGAALAQRALQGNPVLRTEREILRDVLSWGMVTAGLTLFVCWIDLVGALLLAHKFGPGLGLERIFPLLPTPADVGLFRAQLFAVIVAPALQVLTTVFGGVLVIVFRRSGP